MGVLDAPALSPKAAAAKYASKWANRRQSAVRNITAAPAVMSSPPTIAWVAPGGTSPIATPTILPWTTKRVSVFGGKLTKYPNYNYGYNNTNGGWTPGLFWIEFDYVGAGFAVAFRNGATNSAQAWLWVDGAPATADAGTLTAAAGNSAAFFHVAFGSVAPRRIRIYMRNMDFGGLHVAATDSVGPVRAPSIRIGWLGDSWVDSATGATSTPQGLIPTIARILDADIRSCGQGGTAHSNPSTTGKAKYSDPSRIAGVAAHDPDLIIVSGSSNDDGFTSTVAADAAATFAALAVACPGVPVLVIGPPCLPSNSASRIASRDAVKAAALAAPNVLGFLDQLDPAGVLSIATPFAASTVYKIGDIVVDNGIPYECRVDHTSAATRSSSAWEVMTWITGNGKVGATNGTGNADLFIANDATHPSPDGYQMLFARLWAEWILNQMNRLARV